jgi:hypothetical protein
MCVCAMVVLQLVPASRQHIRSADQVSSQHFSQPVAAVCQPSAAPRPVNKQASIAGMLIKILAVQVVDEGMHDCSSSVMSMHCAVCPSIEQVPPQLCLPVAAVARLLHLLTGHLLLPATSMGPHPAARAASLSYTCVATCVRLLNQVCCSAAQPTGSDLPALCWYTAICASHTEIQ